MKKSFGIKKILLGGTVAFVAIMLAALWLCQVVFLDKFYHIIKKNDIEKAAKSVSLIVKKGGVPTNDELFKIGRKYEACIDVLEMKNGALVSLGAADTVPRCVIHSISPDSKRVLYDNANADKDGYLEYFSFDPTRKAYVSAGTDGLRGSEDLSLVYAVVTECEGKTLLLLFNSSVTPISATVSTLYVLLSLFTVVILILTVVFAYFMSRTVAKPIDELTEKAASFGSGDANVDFSVGGYSEVRQLSAALGYASEEIRKTEELRRDFLANVTHDLKTPITLISGYSEMMLDFPEENTPENLRNIVKETERMSALVNEVLDYSRLVSGTVPFDIKKYNLTEQVGELCKRYAEMLRPDGIKLSVELSEDAFVFADPSQAERVLVNFITNAVIHTGEDGVITVKQTVENGWVTVSVTDTGAGIPKEELAGIWERYYKLGKNNSRTAKGSGLGLSIVKTIMERMDGAYGVRSTVGKGSTFWYAFKVASVAPFSAEEKQP